MSLWHKDSDYWAVHAVSKSGHGSPFPVAVLSAVLPRAKASDIATDIATALNTHATLTLYKRGTGPLWKNPTLVHHGRAAAARWHVVGEDGETAVADLYAMSPEAAVKIAQALSDVTGTRVMLLSNYGLPKTLARHGVVSSKSGSRFHGTSRNPEGAPVAGETWTTVRGGRCRVLAVTAARVHVLHLESGKREWIDRGEFLATYRLPKRPNPKKRAKRAKGRKRNPRGIRTFHVDDMRQDIGDRARSLGWLWSAESAAGTAWGATEAEAVKAAEAQLRKQLGAESKARMRPKIGRRNPGRLSSQADADALVREAFGPVGRAWSAAGTYHVGVDVGHGRVAYGSGKSWTAAVAEARRRRFMTSRRRNPKRRRKARRHAKARKNPRDSREYRKAADVFEMWHEFPHDKVTRMKVPSRVMPKHLVALGEVLRIDYKSDKWEGKPVAYTHATKRPRPVLATDPDARQLYLVGGKMRPTADGLVN